MNNKKEQLKKAAAFVSALSFMSVTNFSGINNVSALTLSKVSAVNSGVDADSSITDEEQNDINVDAPVQDNQEESSEVPETPSENENPDIPNIDNKNDSSLMINVRNEEIRDVIVDKIKEEMSDLFNNVKIHQKHEKMIILYYSSDKDKKYVENEFKNRFSYVTDNCIYICGGESDLNIMKGYYRIYNNSNGIVEIVNQDYIRTEENKIYLKSDKINNEYFNVQNGYHLEIKKNISNRRISDVITIDSTSIKMGDTEIFSIVEDDVNININVENIEISGMEKSISIKPTDINKSNQQITFKCKEGYNKIKIGNSYVESEISLSIKDLLEQAGYAVTDKGIIKGDETGFSKIDISVIGIPSTINVECTIDGETVEAGITCKVDEINNILIPLMIKKDGIDYYLSEYSCNGTSNICTSSDAINEVYKKISYGDSLEYVIYKPFDKSEVEISKEEIINALTAVNEDNVNEKNCFERNKYVVDVKGTTILFKFPAHDERNVNKFKGITLIFADDKGNIYSQTINDAALGGLSLNQDAKFYKVVSILDSESKSISFTEPVYIYLDQKEPEVAVSNEYQNNEKWSNESTYKFSFSVSDGEIPEGISEELKKDYEKINENPKLASVKSITIGGLELNAEKNWTAKNEDYSIKVTPTFSKDENGVMVGNFQAEFTLISETKKAFDETIHISATDNCDNTTSATGEVKIRIDKEAPVVNFANVENINENNNIGGDELTISAGITDNASGVKSVEFTYGDKSISVSEDNGNGEYKGTLDISENDLTGKIQIIVTDKAGNTKTYYYSDSVEETHVTENQNDATTIVKDGENPVVTVSESGEADYTDKTDEKRWYKDYPEISINSSDNQGIKKISISINGNVIEKEVTDEFVRTLSGKDEISDEDIKDILENLKLEFKPCDNNQQFNASINSILLADDKGNAQLFSLGSDGKLEVNVVAEDYSGNNSSPKNEHDPDNSKTVVYIDNNAPTTSGIIERESEDDVHFRKFGTFANNQVNIKVKLSDKKDVNSDNDNIVASSGIKYLKLEFAGKEYNGQIYESEPEWVFFNIPVPELQSGLKLPENTSISGEMVLKAEDNVGNILTFNKNTSVDNTLVNDYVENEEHYNSSNVIVENKKPVIKVIQNGDNRYDNGSEVWYSSDVTVECNITDNADGDSGLSEVNFSRSQQRASTKGLTDIGNYKNDNEKKTEYSGKLSTEEGADGKAVFSINATDNAGNSVNEKIEVNKDITAPSITRFEFYSPILSRSPLSIVQDRIERFGYFFDSATVMTVYAEDTNASSGIKSIYCRLINSDGTVFKEERIDNPAFENGMYYAGFEIPEGFKGDIRAWAVDNVKNTSREVSPDGLASENQSRHDSHSSIVIEMPQTEYTDINGLPLYSDNVTASVIIDDDFSGIKTVEWTTSDSDGWQRIDIDDNGNIYGDYDGWSVERIERNIALSVSNNITVSRDANDDSIIVRITDNSGNVSENEVHFSIDKQAPVISASGIQQSPEIKYYNSSQQAHIVISERNFSTPVINGSADGGFAEDPDSIRNTDDFRHIKDISYDSDGTYSLEIEDTDLAGNIAARYSSGTFVIDKTAPVLEVEFSKQSGEKADPKKSSYINDIISAKISVEELNFDSSRISVRINNKEYKPTDWKEINGKHMATIPYDEFKEDGEYTVSISGTDLASNSFKSYSASFVIDTESPEIEFSGFETANKGEVSPVIKIEDINLDEYGLKVYRNNKLCEMSYDKVKEVYSFDVSDNNDCITGKWLEKTVDGKVHKEFIFDDFPSDECFDGSYSIDVSASDKAENSRNETRQFSVNRFGSVFKVENIENINGKYLNKAPNISITETNVDKHQEGSEIIVILDKGSVTEQLDETMYDVSEPEMLDDKSGYVYNYVIKAGNFNQDLDYRISIQTVDEAGNKNVSTSRGAEFGFNVDTHEPEFKCDELIERAEFRESEKTFRLNANEKLKHITVTTSLDEVLLDLDADDDKDRNDNSYTFVMPASNVSRSVTVELTDLAGNKTIETYNNLLITENMLLYLFHKTWIKVTGGIAVLGVGTAGGFTIAGKRRRRRIK